MGWSLQLRRLAPLGAMLLIALVGCVSPENFWTLYLYRRENMFVPLFTLPESFLAFLVPVVDAVVPVLYSCFLALLLLLPWIIFRFRQRRFLIVLQVLWLTAFTALHLPAHATVVGMRFHHEWRVSRIQVGMTQQQMLEVVGPPDRYDNVSSNPPRWEYVFSETSYRLRWAACISRSVCSVAFDEKGCVADVHHSSESVYVDFW